MLVHVSQNVAFAYNCHQTCWFTYPKMLHLHTTVIKYVGSRIPKCCFCIQLSSNMLVHRFPNFAFAYNCYQICWHTYLKMLLLRTTIIPKYCFCVQQSLNMLAHLSPNVAFAYNRHEICWFTYSKMLLSRTTVISYIGLRIPKCSFCMQLSRNMLVRASQHVAFAYNCHQICWFTYSRMLLLHTTVHEICWFMYPNILLLHTTVIKYVGSRIPEYVAFAYNFHQICWSTYPKMLLLHATVIKYVVSRIPTFCFSKMLVHISQNVAFAYNCHQIYWFMYAKSCLRMHLLQICWFTYPKFCFCAQPSSNILVYVSQNVDFAYNCHEIC